MYFYEKQYLPLSPIHTTLGELLGAVDRSIALFTQQDRVRFFHQVTMRHLRVAPSPPRTAPRSEHSMRARAERVEKVERRGERPGGTRSTCHCHRYRCSTPRATVGGVVRARRRAETSYLA